MSEMLDPQELRDAIRDVLNDRRGGVYATPGEDGFGFDRELWAQMAELGWLALAIPEDAGGLGLGVDHLAVLYEELGRDLSPVPMLTSVIVAQAIAKLGSETLRALYLPAFAAGDCTASLALPQLGAPLTRDDAGRLSGILDGVLFGDVADIIAVPVQGGGVPALAILKTDAAGLAITPRPLVDLTRSAARVEIDGAVPEALIEMNQTDWDALYDHAAVGLSCDAIGGAAALFDMTIDYMKTREQFGRQIGSFQALKHRVADWKAQLEAVSALARHAAALLGAQDATASANASGAKAYACDTYAAFAGDAVQLHGGIGFTWEHPCHLFLKRAKLGQQMFGASSAHKDRVAALAFSATETATL